VSLCIKYFIHRNIDERGSLKRRARGGSPRPKDGPDRYPLDRRLGGPQSQSERRAYEKNFSPLPGTESRSSSL
jgi:hypothetical protein